MRYFGYGSNLHLSDVARWCAERGYDATGLRPAGPAWLPDAEAVFHYCSRARGGGALSVRSRRGAAVPGLLFDVDDAARAALDAKEGAPRFYERVERVVVRADGREERAFTYVVVPARREDRHVPPTETYRRTVLEGLRSHGLPTAQVEGAARSLDPPPLPRCVFVYGTLRRGELRAPLMERHAPRRWVEARTLGSLIDLGEYPGLIPGTGDETVRGELVELTDPADALAELDEVEDFLGYGRPGSLYRRVVASVQEHDGRRSAAWTYLYLGPRGGAPTIPSGDWRAR